MVALAWFSARTSVAAEATEEDKSRGRVLLAEGLALMDNGDAEQALAKFQAAYQIVPSPKVLFNMGLAHQALGHTVAALGCFEGFLGELPDAPEDARAYAQRQVELLRANVSFVDISANLPGSEARIDEQTVGLLPLKKPIVVQPGAHVVSVRTNGHEVFRQPMTAVAGRQSRVYAVVSSSASGERRDHSGWQRPALWVAAGVSGVALVAGITGHVLYESRGSEYRDLLGKGQCYVGAPERSHCESLRSDASAGRTLLWIGYSVAALSAGTALTLWLLEPKSDRSLAGDRPGIACGPIPGLAGLTCAGRY